MLGLKKYGVDWSGIFPAIGYSFLGGFVGELLYAKKKSIVLLQKDAKDASDTLIEKIFKPITYIGSKTIYIYLLHQLVIGAITIILFLILRVPFR
jgi:fucose 4-O-acetylase-like acetyltransferase